MSRGSPHDPQFPRAAEAAGGMEPAPPGRMSVREVFATLAPNWVPGGDGEMAIDEWWNTTRAASSMAQLLPAGARGSPERLRLAKAAARIAGMCAPYLVDAERPVKQLLARATAYAGWEPRPTRGMARSIARAVRSCFATRWDASGRRGIDSPCDCILQACYVIAHGRLEARVSAAAACWLASCALIDRMPGEREANRAAVQLRCADIIRQEYPDVREVLRLRQAERPFG